jgi:putative membrane protein
MRREFRCILVLTAGSLCLYPAAALAQHPGAGGGAPSMSRPDTTSQNSQTDTGQREPKRIDEKKFIQDAAVDDLTEVAMGKLAVEKGSDDAIKQYGQKLIDDHTKANGDLKELAAAGRIEVPDALDSKHQARVDKLAKLSGPQFDKAFIKDQVKFHQQNVKDFQEEAASGTIVQVKNYASKALPTLEQHLELVKELSKNKK